MCGILGHHSFFLPITATAKKSLQTQLDTLVHRGPDAQGIFADNKTWLGHRRLSIIDTNNRSDQPFKIGDYVLIYNGEIYNYQKIKQDLKKAGETFETTSDTEVLLKGYIRYKEKLFDMLDGMWAFAIYNQKTRDLILCRDRIGEKPLYIARNNERILFSSELPSMKPLLTEDEKKVNWQALALFNTLNLNHIPSPLTPYMGVEKLLPGCYLKCTKGEVQVKQYFKIKKIAITKPVKQAKMFLKDAVDRTLIADVPVGILLSGGVDSSLIAALSKEKNIITYSFGMDKNDPELKRAKAVAKQLNLTNRQVIFKGSKAQSDPIAYFRKLVHEFGEPFNLYQVAYTRQLLQTMHNDGIKVAIGGNGADELFYGYDGANKLRLLSDIRSLLDTAKITPLLYRLTGSLLFAQREKIKSLRYQKAMQKPYLKEKYRTFPLSSLFQKYANEIPSKKTIDIFNWLGLRVENEHSVTMVVDHAGMRESMEVRTPFLNKDIIDFATSLPVKYKTGYTGKTKLILREVLADLLPSTAQESKMGFGYNVKHQDPFLTQTKEVKEIFSSILPKLDIYKKDIVDDMLQEHLDGKSHYHELMEILIIALWFEECC